MKIIHINKNIIQRNNKREEREPVVRVEYEYWDQKTRRQKTQTKYCMEVELPANARMVYRPDRPRPCGAKLWIETKSRLVLHGVKGRKSPLRLEACDAWDLWD